MSRIVLVTPRAEFAKGVNYCSQIGVMRRLYQSGVELIPATEVVGRSAEGVRLRNVYSGQEKTLNGVDYLLWSSPRQANVALLSALSEKGVQIRMVGDCVSPRNLTCAIHEGRTIAMAH